jgi:hypothetical protein
MGAKRWVAQGNQWMLSMCADYFRGGYALRTYRRRAARRGGDAIAATAAVARPDGECDRDSDLLEGRDVRLLDVGSCYNPFKEAAGFKVTALDLCPTDASVLQCDFLALQVGGDAPVLTERSGVTQLVSLAPASFEAVTMSLVLNYLPSPELRADMVAKARQLLVPANEGRPHSSGLLLIAEKESAFAADKDASGRTLVSAFEGAVEAAGFERVTHRELRVDGRTTHVFTFRRIDSARPLERVPLLLRQDVAFKRKTEED